MAQPQNKAQIQQKHTRRSGKPRTRAPKAALLPAHTLRWVGIAVLAVGLGAGAYLAARETSVFAVQTLEVRGASARVKVQVRRVLGPVLGRSLLRVDDGQLTRLVDALPDVISVHFDRSFPHTLRITVHAERPVLLVRQGSTSWVVSARGRVMRQLASPKRSSLPRLWLPKTVKLATGETLTRDNGKLAAAAVAPISAHTFAGGVRTVESGADSLTLVLRSGLQLRLGGIGDLGLKFTIARRILHLARQQADVTPIYVDVSVPERPVMGTG